MSLLMDVSERINRMRDLGAMKTIWRLSTCEVDMSVPSPGFLFGFGPLSRARSGDTDSIMHIVHCTVQELSEHGLGGHRWHSTLNTVTILYCTALYFVLQCAVHWFSTVPLVQYNGTVPTVQYTVAVQQLQWLHGLVQYTRGHEIGRQLGVFTKADLGASPAEAQRVIHRKRRA